jgi:hypothetical protein
MRDEMFTANEALMLVRFFTKLQAQIDLAVVEGRLKDAFSMGTLYGRLSYEIFAVSLADDFGKVA